MYYEVDALLTFKRNSTATAVGSRVDMRLRRTVVKMNMGAASATEVSGHTINNGTECDIALFFIEQGDAEEFCEWLETLHVWLDYSEGSENYYILKEVTETGDEVISSFAFVEKEDSDVVFPVWSQPSHSGDSYPKDAVVAYRGSLWQSTVDFNVWQPDVSGWKPYVTEEGTLPQWVQPTGAHDSYAMGAEVTHNGADWRSDANDNVWEPGEFGWNQINQNP